VAVIADDYSFGYTSAAGFIADFCAAGGDVVARVFPPLGTTDYSSFVQQLPDPDEVDGYFWAVGGTGTNTALEAFVNAKGDLDGSQHAGNLFFSPALASALGPSIAGAYVGGFASLPGDVKTPEIEAYLASADATWESLPAGAGGGAVGPPSVALGFGFGYGYYVAGTALVQALTETGSTDPEALQSALGALELDLPYGPVKLDENRQGIIDTFVAQLVLDPDTGEVVQQTKYIVPGVDQTFGGTYSSETDPLERDNTPCEKKELPWQGNLIPVVDDVPQR
jgi:branched-chain amino acid transport system substrate-binding protein